MFQSFCWFSRKSRKLSKNQWKSTKTNENRLIYRLYVIRETPGTARVLWYCVVIIPKAPHTTPSILETGDNPWAWGAPNRSATQLNLFSFFSDLFSFFSVQNPEKIKDLYTSKKYKTIWWAGSILNLYSPKLDWRYVIRSKWSKRSQNGPSYPNPKKMHQSAYLIMEDI